MDQITFYEMKLAYETDSWDLSEALKKGENLVQRQSQKLGLNW